jgi:hypothetical protein
LGGALRCAVIKGDIESGYVDMVSADQPTKATAEAWKIDAKTKS